MADLEVVVEGDEKDTEKSTSRRINAGALTHLHFILEACGMLINENKIARQGLLMYFPRSTKKTNPICLSCKTNRCLVRWSFLCRVCAYKDDVDVAVQALMDHMSMWNRVLQSINCHPPQVVSTPGKKCVKCEVLLKKSVLSVITVGVAGTVIKTLLNRSFCHRRICGICTTRLVIEAIVHRALSGVAEEEYKDVCRCLADTLWVLGNARPTVADVCSCCCMPLQVVPRTSYKFSNQPICIQCQTNGYRNIYRACAACGRLHNFCSATKGIRYVTCGACGSDSRPDRKGDTKPRKQSTVDASAGTAQAPPVTSQPNEVPDKTSLASSNPVKS